ncbi:LPS-assembly protein LptD [Acidobacteria bacterium AB60]|nr:LPS-assembly protein LptD [Acidobacteria bacterium AB60]
MRPRNFVFITMLVLCHGFAAAQALTNGLPLAQSETPRSNGPSKSSASLLPDDPGEEILPVAQPEPEPSSGVPVTYKADRQRWAGNVLTLEGVEDFRYRDYVFRADKVIWHRDTNEIEAEGNLHVTGGPEDVDVIASHGDIQLANHTARFFDVTGTMGVRSNGKAVVYSTANPFIIHARVLLQTARGSYRVVDGSMTNCRLPHPDWQLFAHFIDVANGHASTRSTYFKFLGVPLFYLPYLRHPVDQSGRESGLLIPVISNYSSIRGYTFGEQVYAVINRSMDITLGTEYYSRRGWAPNGDFRYRGPGVDHLNAGWHALFDRGINQLQTAGEHAGKTIFVNQGGVDIVAQGRKDYSPEDRLAGDIEYLSRYLYRLEFNDNYWQAISSEVKSEVSYTHAHNGLIPSADLYRLQSFASSSVGDEVRILRLPSIRYDVLDRPLGSAPLYWGLGSSLGHLARSEPGFHAHNDGRSDIYPHLSMPLVGGGWSLIPEAAFRVTFYSGSQVPDLSGAQGGVPGVTHDPLRRTYGEASVDLRPPALERDFAVRGWGLRHVIEPELNWHFVGGVGSKARDVLLVDTSDIATDTNEVGFSLTQRFYARPPANKPCPEAEGEEATQDCGHSREWASWQIAQKYYLDSKFGGALLPGRRNVFDSTLDLTGIAFLTEGRNLSPIVSRMRFNAIENLRIQWDLDYDPRAGRLGADNVFAGYSWGNTTVGLGHSLLNAVDEKGSSASIIQSDQVNPFVEIGKPTSRGFNFAANGGYDFVRGSLQYGGVQAVYNWNCCGLTVGYRRFALGSIRDETQYLYGFTLANFGSVGHIRRSNSVFRDPSITPVY